MEKLPKITQKSPYITNEKAEAIEEMLSTIPKHKGTDKLRADYRRKLSKLKTESKSQMSIIHKQ